MSVVFDFIVNQLTIFQDPLKNFILIAIITSIIFSLAWRLSPGGRFGSEIHWIFRFLFLFIFLIVLSIVSFVIRIVLSVPVYLWVLILVALIVGLVYRTRIILGLEMIQKIFK